MVTRKTGILLTILYVTFFARFDLFFLSLVCWLDFSHSEMREDKCLTCVGSWSFSSDREIQPFVSQVAPHGGNVSLPLSQSNTFLFEGIIGYHLHFSFYCFLSHPLICWDYLIRVNLCSSGCVLHLLSGVWKWNDLWRLGTRNKRGLRWKPKIPLKGERVCRE